MKLYRGNRIGQSEQELTASVIFSFFLHVIFLVTALFLYTRAAPKRFIPPVYDVKLVSQPREVVPATSKAEPLPAPPKPTEKAPPKEKKAPQKELKPPAKKGDMPELAKQKQEKSAEQVKPQQPAPPPPAPPPPAPPAPAPSVAKAEATTPIDVKMPPGFKKDDFSFYAAQLRSRIAANWNPLPVPKDTRVKIVFTVLRSGWVEEVKLEETSGNFQFDQAAIRAIRDSSPFPRLPEAFYKPSAVFSAYLMPE